MAKRIIETPVGNMLVPEWKIKELDGKKDEQLIKEYQETKRKGFIEPFLFNELHHRGIFHKV